MSTQKLLGWIVTPLTGAAVLAALSASQLALMLTLRVSFKRYLSAVNLGYFLVLLAVRLSGARYHYPRTLNLPKDRPLIIASNHQSLLDIPLIGWVFRAYRPKFVAKIELERGIPGVSHALRHMGSLLINRAEKQAAVRAIEEFGRRLEEGKECAVIFPEGTRSRDGVLRKFKAAGLGALLKSMPSALIVPVAIDGSWQLMRWKMLPVPFGIKVNLKVLDPLERTDLGQDISGLVEQRLREALKSCS